MEWAGTFFLLLGGLVLLMLTGLPVAFSFLVVTFTAMWGLMGWQGATDVLVRSIFDSLTKFNLTAIPFFVLMGEVLFHSGLASRTMDALSKWVGRLPGRLSVITLLAGGLFAALSGSTVANTAMLGSLMVPEMMKRGYSKTMTMGPIMASGALAMVIPPSALAVLLGSLAEVSIGTLLIAAITPGVVLLVLYLAYTMIRCLLNPSHAPAYEVEEASWRERLLSTLRDLVPLFGIIAIFLGFMFYGLATPTEAAALGSLGAFILTACYGRLKRETIVKSMYGALNVTVMILTIIAGSAAFSQILAFSGASRGMVQMVLGLGVNPMVILWIMLGIVIVLGCFMEQVSIMMITIPMFMPIMRALGFDPIWFAILVLICLEIGQLSPPVGLALFVMKGAAPEGVTMQDVYAAALPYVLLDLAGVLLLVYLPDLTMWLPNLIR